MDFTGLGTVLVTYGLVAVILFAYWCAADFGGLIGLPLTRVLGNAVSAAFWLPLLIAGQIT